MEFELFTLPTRDSEVSGCLKCYQAKRGHKANRVAFRGQISKELEPPVGVKFVIAKFTLTRGHIAVYYEDEKQRSVR